MKWLLLVALTFPEQGIGLAPVGWFDTREACIEAGQGAVRVHPRGGKWGVPMPTDFICAPGPG